MMEWQTQTSKVSLLWSVLINHKAAIAFLWVVNIQTRKVNKICDYINSLGVF